MNMPIDRIRFVTPDEKIIACSLCNTGIGSGGLINEFEYKQGKIDIYCMNCLREQAAKTYVWEREE